MKTVSKEDKRKWGSYEDRKDSFDDDGDISAFVSMAKNNPKLREFIASFIKGGNYNFISKPYGDYDVDFALVDGEEVIATFDVERWNAWNPDWPSFYKYISFLDRKVKFLNNPMPFFMCFMNYPRTKTLIVEKDAIKKYRSVDKNFANHHVTDKIKKIPFHEGSLFGSDFSEKEKSLWQR